MNFQIVQQTTRRELHFVEYNGTWSAQGDNLELHFETMKIEAGGEVPIAKQRIAVPVCTKKT